MVIISVSYSLPSTWSIQGFLSCSSIFLSLCWFREKSGKIQVCFWIEFISSANTTNQEFGVRGLCDPVPLVVCLVPDAVLSQLHMNTTIAWSRVRMSLKRELGPVNSLSSAFGLCGSERWWRCVRSHDAIGDVLEGVIEFGGDGAHGSIHQLLHQQLQLLLRQTHVETFLQAADGAGAVETGKVGTWWGGGTPSASRAMLWPPRSPYLQQIPH